jgi:hypothetical protein
VRKILYVITAFYLDRETVGIEMYHGTRECRNEAIAREQIDTLVNEIGLK